jgi:hypothetical protein
MRLFIRLLSRNLAIDGKDLGGAFAANLDPFTREWVSVVVQIGMIELHVGIPLISILIDLGVAPTLLVCL